MSLPVVEADVMVAHCHQHLRILGHGKEVVEACNVLHILLGLAPLALVKQVA